MDIKNIFDIRGMGAGGGEIFEALIKTPGLLVERIISKGQITPTGEWYDQEADEWVVLLTGRSRLRFDDEVVEMYAGDYLFIPSHRKHRVEFTSSDPACIWLAIHGNL